MKFCYAIFALFLATYSFSQNSLKNYHYGSYTTQEGEVIKGDIKDLGLTAMSHSIKYKKGDASGPKWFSWNEIRSYRFKGLTFVSIGSKGCFMQQVTYGQLSLYRKFYIPGTMDVPSPETFRYYLRLKG